MITFESILDRAKESIKELNEQRLVKAFKMAEKIHEGEILRTGDSLLNHLIGVADILLKFKPDEDSLIACLLHSVSFGKNEKADIPIIEKEFGKEVAQLVQGLIRLKAVKYQSEYEEEIDNLRKLFLAMTKDLRVVFIRLADVLQNMRMIEVLSDEERKNKAKEALEIYTPLAGRLGIYSLKSELEDISFRYLYPDKYFDLKRDVAAYIEQRENSITEIKRILQQILRKEGIEAAVQGRVKHLYSIYRKLKRKNKNSVSDIYDIFAIRVILPDLIIEGKESVEHCYRVLGIVHQYFTPLSKRFKDYIAVSKINGYRSLHTTVIGFRQLMEKEQPVEIQIRTESMHAESEYGISSHWSYKDNSRNLMPKDKVEAFIKGEGNIEKIKSENHLKNQIRWVKELAKLQSDITNDNEFMENLKIDLFKDRIFVLTPGGEVKDLPAGATPVDFAYAVHSDLGHSCQMAKVNGEIVSLGHELKNGDVVEIIPKKEQKPNRYWLSFVQTSLARQKIKNWFTDQDKEKNLNEGRNLLNKYLRRLRKPVLDSELKLLKNFGGKELSIKEREGILESVGSGAYTPITILKNIFSPEQMFSLREREGLTQKEEKSAVINQKEQEADNVLIQGEPGIVVRMPMCCKPRFNDYIVGYVTRGKGITVHRMDCSLLKGVEEDRLIEACWGKKMDVLKEKKYMASVRVFFIERKSFLSDVIKILSELNIGILRFSSKDLHGTNREKVLNMILKIADANDLYQVFAKLETVTGVMKVKEGGK